MRTGRTNAIRLSLLALIAPVVAFGQTYPARPIRIIVPFPASGTADLLPRIIGESLAGKWGQPVVVDNRPGAVELWLAGHHPVLAIVIPWDRAVLDGPEPCGRG